MRRRKQILSVLLTASMMASMLVGCGAAEEKAEEPVAAATEEAKEEVKAEEPVKDSKEVAAADDSNKGASADELKEVESGIPRISEEVITITVEAPTGAVARDWNQTQQWQAYEEKMGIKFNLIGSYTNEQWDSRETLMFASDEMPDLVCLGNSAMTRDEVQKYASEGFLLDWTPYLEYMPNVTALMEEYPEFKTMATFDDGGIYGWPQVNVSNVWPNCIPQYVFVNKQWCENLGIEYPKTVEELYDTLVAFKEQDANGNGDPNDEQPMISVKDNFDVLKPIQWAFGVTDRAQVYHLYADENGKVGIHDNQENYKEFLRYVNRLYEEGLINQDMFVIENAEVNEYVNANRAGYFGNTGYDVQAAHIKECVSPVGFTSEYNEEATLVAGGVVSSSFMHIANVELEEEKAIALAKWIDFIYTDIGQLSMRNGFDGVTFEFNEIVPGHGIPDHMPMVEAYGYGNDQNAYRNELALAMGMGTAYVAAYGTIYDALAYAEDPLADEVWVHTTLNALREVTIRDNPDVKIINSYPNVFFTTEEATERATLKVDIENYLKTAYAQFISGEMDIDADWDTYLNELDKIGLSRLLELEQAAYDRL